MKGIQAVMEKAVARVEAAESASARERAWMRQSGSPVLIGEPVLRRWSMPTVGSMESSARERPAPRARTAWPMVAASARVMMPEAGEGRSVMTGATWSARPMPRRSGSL